MSRKNVLPYKVLSAKSLATDFQSPATLIKNSDNIAYQINVTTTNSVGTFAVQASLDYAVDEVANKITNAGNWIDLPLGGTPAVAMQDDQILINLNELPFAAVRLAYTGTTPGTGHCDAFILTKQIGG